MSEQYMVGNMATASAWPNDDSECIDFPALPDNFNLDSCNLSIESIYDDYPVECIPTKINKS